MLFWAKNWLFRNRSCYWKLKKTKDLKKLAHFLCLPLIEKMKVKKSEKTKWEDWQKNCKNGLSKLKIWKVKDFFSSMPKLLFVRKKQKIRKKTSDIHFSQQEETLEAREHSTFIFWCHFSHFFFHPTEVRKKLGKKTGF